MKKSICLLILGCFFFTSIIGPNPVYAQSIALPAPGVMVYLSPEYTPALLKGIVIDPKNAFKFDFIIYRGDKQFTDAQKKQEYTKLIKYFLASLAVPDEDQWVNLSPYEKNRIIKEDFGKTEMGRDLLAQDYLLKQITASLIYPQGKLGQQFWDSVYACAYKQFGTTNIPVNTFNKVWIMPDEADIYERGNAAYLYKSHLKVMLEEDYLSLSQHQQNKSHSIASQVVRQIILPQLEREVNTAKNFAPLRQVFSGMILAAWYKRALRRSLLASIYANKGKVRGVDQPACRQAGIPCVDNEFIYQQYLKAYKKGVFDYIKEDIDQYTHETIPRKYFSGGTALVSPDAAMDAHGQPVLKFMKINPPNAAMATAQDLAGGANNTGLDEAMVNLKRADNRATLSQKADLLFENGMIYTLVTIMASAVQQQDIANVSITVAALSFILANIGNVKATLERTRIQIKHVGFVFSRENGGRTVILAPDNPWTAALEGELGEEHRAELRGWLTRLGARHVRDSGYGIRMFHLDAPQEKLENSTDPAMGSIMYWVLKLIVLSKERPPMASTVNYDGDGGIDTDPEEKAEETLMMALKGKMDIESYGVTETKITVTYTRHVLDTVKSIESSFISPQAQSTITNAVDYKRQFFGEVVRSKNVRIDDTRIFFLPIPVKSAQALFKINRARWRVPILKKRRVYTEETIPSFDPLWDAMQKPLFEKRINNADLEYIKTRRLITPMEIGITIHLDRPDKRLGGIDVDDEIWEEMKKTLIEALKAEDVKVLSDTKDILIIRILSKSESWAKQRIDNMAMSADQAQSSDWGGIDMNAAHLKMNIKHDGQEGLLPVSKQDWAQIHIEGLVPEILEIRPASVSYVLSQLTI